MRINSVPLNAAIWMNISLLIWGFSLKCLCFNLETNPECIIPTRCSRGMYSIFYFFLNQVLNTKGQTRLLELLIGLPVQLIAVNRMLSEALFSYEFVATNSVQWGLCKCTLYLWRQLIDMWAMSWWCWKKYTGFL